MNNIFVTFTFDDGNISQYVYLYPILDSYGYRATFYIVASQIGWHGKINADKIQDLRKRGNEIGSHSYSHFPLTELPDRKLELELKMSKELLHASTFAYPFGYFNKKVIEHVKEYYVAARAYEFFPHESDICILQKYTLRSIPLDNLLTLPPSEFESILDKMFNRQLVEKVANRVENGYWVIFTMHGRPSFSFDWWLWHIREKGLGRTLQLLPIVLRDFRKEKDAAQSLSRSLFNLEYLASLVNAGSYIVKPLVDVVRFVYK